MSLPYLMRIEGDAIICGGCRRQWAYTGEISEANADYLYEHAIGHRPVRQKVPAGTGAVKRSLQHQRYVDPKLCEECNTYFNTNRCPRCHRNYPQSQKTTPHGQVGTPYVRKEVQ